MRYINLLFHILLFCVFSFQTVFGQKILKKKSEIVRSENAYTMIVDGYDWGAAVSKVVLFNGTKISSVDKNDFTVLAERSTACVELTGSQASGERNIVHAYISDSKGKLVKEGDYITLVLSVGPNLSISNPFQYTRNEKCRGNNWVDYKMLVVNKSTHQVWNKEAGRIIPLVDEFELSGTFREKDAVMSYASFVPKTSRKKSPLIIWLHGGGEGGTDPTIPLLANKAANYASPEIQNYFGGAYVLVPQSPTFWMDKGNGEYTRGKEDDTYNQTLMALIKDYVVRNPGVDVDRIYVGGCSNGGYMSLKLLLLYPDYFAAGFISALAYQTEYISDQQLSQIKNIPIWFIHSKDDPVTVPEKTVVPVYERLMKAGAPDVHFSYYDHVVDLTGFYGGDNYHFSGHWSWIYSHTNHCVLDYDGQPVLQNGKPITIMEWMASKKNK